MNVLNSVLNYICLLFQTGKKKWLSQRCIVGNCKRDARLGSVYCSSACIVRHAQESLQLLRKDKEHVSGLKVFMISI